MLGFVYVKLAEEASSAMEQVLGGPVQTSSASGAPTVTGTGTLAQVGGAAVADMFGPEFAPFVQMFLPLLPEAARSRLTQQHRFFAGAGTTAEAQEVSQALAAANQRLMAKNGSVMAQRLASVIKELPSDGVGGWFKQHGYKLTALAQMNPGVAGQIVGMLRQADIPVLSPLLNQFLADVPTSYTPIVQSVYQENRGVIDPQQLQQRVDEFEQAFNAGAFVSRETTTDPKTGEVKPLPMTADVALGSYGIAAQSLGSKATLNDRVELARLAQSVMSHGLATSSVVAYEMLKALGPSQALRDPVAFDSKMARIAQRAKALGGDVPKAMLGAFEMAAKQGVPLEHAIERTVASGEREQVWAQSGRSPQQIAQLRNLDQATEVTRTKGFAEAESTKGLAAWVTNTPQGRKAFDAYLAKPTAQGAAQMFAASRNSPTWAQRGAYDPETVKSYLDPEAMSTLQMGEQIAFAGAMGGKANSRLQNILANPEKYRAMLEDPLSMDRQQQKEYTGLSYHDKKWLSNPGLRGIAADYMARRSSAQKPLPPTRLPAHKALTQEDTDKIKATPVIPKPIDDRPRTA